MRGEDFGAYYAALGLSPSATDEDVARAKRAYNELYHSDRLAHMSEHARTIAGEKVRLANEAAQALLAPANRTAREAWRRTAREDRPSPPPRGERQDSEPSPGVGSEAGPSIRPEPAGGRRTARSHTARLLMGSVAAGGVLGTLAVLASDHSVRVAPPAAAPSAAADSGATPASEAMRAKPRRSAVTVAPVTDSIVVLSGDGRWTSPVVTGGSSFRTSFVPESDGALYRVRVDAVHEEVFLGEPGFQKLTAPAQRYEFSSLTGNPVRLKFSRWRTAPGPGQPVHTLAVPLAPDGSWGRRIYLGALDVGWEPDRPVQYEAQDDRGRVIRLMPSVSSVYFEVPPQWIRFRSVDSQPLTVVVRYTTR